MPDIAVRVQNVSKRYRLYSERPQSLKEAIIHRRGARYHDLWAVNDVSLEVERGSTYGLIGPNGSGKSTLLKLIARVHKPTSGTVEAHGRMGTLLELGAGFHPDLTGRENVYLNGSIMGLSRKEIRHNVDDIITFSGLEKFVDSPVKVYSSGMYVRLAFSVAVNLKPDILLIDEVLTVGDEEFQRRCMEHIFKMRAKGVTIIFVSHSLATVQSICDEVAWLESGKIVALGKPSVVIDEYLQRVNEAERDQMAQTQDEGEKRQDQTMPGEERWGSGEIQIRSLELFDPGGKPVHAATTGAPLTLRINFDIRRPVNDCTFGIGFYSNEGTLIAEPNTNFAGLSIERIDARGHIDLLLENLSLVEGRYVLSPYVFDRHMLHCYDYRYMMAPLLVRPGRGSEKWGLVDMEGTWGPPRKDKSEVAPAETEARFLDNAS